MAEYEERSLDDLTEEPSQHKLDELRSKGQIAQSRELTAALVFLGVLTAMYFFSTNFFHNYQSLLKDVFTKDLLAFKSTDELAAFGDLGKRCGMLLIMTFIPVAVTVVILAIGGSVAQTGFIFTSETIQPDFDRVSPISGFKRVFSTKSLVEGMKSVIKLTFVITAIYTALKSDIFESANLINMDVNQIIQHMGMTTFKAMIGVGFLLFVAAGIDYWIQWRRFQLQARMTKQEAKKESKDREGDPQIKARIRAIQRESARKRMMKAVPKADVIITNPTHFAIAIVYNPQENFAPKVVAKGADFLAQKIKQIAKENNVPMVENVALARTLYKYVKVGQLIPRSLYQAVAEVLAYVYKLRGKAAKMRADTSGEAKSEPRMSPDIN